MVMCVVVLPLVALFGTSLPDTIKQVLQRQFGVNVASFSLSSWTAWPSGAAPSGPIPLDPTAKEPLPAVPPSGGTELLSPSGLSQPASLQASIAPAALAPAAAAPTTMTLSTLPAAVTAPATAMPVAPGMAVAIAPATALAALSPARPLAVASAWPDHSSASQAAAGVVPAGFQAQIDANRAGRAPAGNTAILPAGGAGLNGGDRFTLMQSRLKELGATYTLLESWGSKGDLYRFYCKLAIGGNVNYTRYFEATDPDSFSAMAKVLQQVEAWRAGRF